MRSSWWRFTQPAKASTRKCRAWGMAGGYMAQTRPSPTLSRAFTRPGRFLAPYAVVPPHLGRPDADPRRPHEAAVRRHATLPQAWIQPENWEFETREPAPAQTATLGPPGRRCSTAEAPGRPSQFLCSRSRISGRLINRTLRGLAQCLDAGTTLETVVRRLGIKACVPTALQADLRALKRVGRAEVTARRLRSEWELRPFRTAIDKVLASWRGQHPVYSTNTAIAYGSMAAPPAPSFPSPPRSCRPGRRKLPGSSPRRRSDPDARGRSGCNGCSSDRIPSIT